MGLVSEAGSTEQRVIVSLCGTFGPFICEGLPFHEFGCAAEGSDDGATADVLGSGFRGATGVTLGDALGAVHGVLAGVIEVEGDGFVRFPHEPIFGAEVGLFVGAAGTGVRVGFISTVTADCTGPGVGGHLHLAGDVPGAVLTGTALGDVFGAFEGHIGLGEVVAQLTHLEEVELVSFAVLAGDIGDGAGCIGEGAIILGGIGPAVGACGDGAPAGVRHEVSVVTGVHGHGQEHLLDVIEVNGGLGLVFGLRQGGQEHAGQDGDDGDDDEQFDQGEAGPLLAVISRLHSDWA